MALRHRLVEHQKSRKAVVDLEVAEHPGGLVRDSRSDHRPPCLLYTSDAADERSSVDLGGRRIIKKKNKARNGTARS